MTDSSGRMVPDERVPVRGLERRVLAVAVSVLLHMVLLALGAIATVVVVRIGTRPSWPREPLLFTAVSLVLAHCSLGAIWWARTTWSPNIKTLFAAISAGGMWLLLLFLLDNTRQSGVASVAWGCAVLTQAAVTAVGATVVEFVVDRRLAAARNRFGIGYLLIWTSVIAVVLGAVGAWASRGGWKVADVPGWEFFSQLEVVGLAGGALASGMYAAVRLPREWRVRGTACALVTILVAAVVPAVMHWFYRDHLGAQVADVVWLLGGEGIFLIVTLVPLELAACGDGGWRYDQSAVTS